MSHRDTIFLEEAEILDHTAYPGEQFVLRIHAPKCAAAATPGSFAHLTCGPALPMRRPLSIMRTSAEQGWVEFLYKVVGVGTRELSGLQPGMKISNLGPIGQGFTADTARRRSLLIGGGVGIPPMIFLADKLRRQRGQFDPFVIMGSEVPFPFQPRPSRFIVPGIPDGVIAAMPLLEDWEIPSRLTSLQGYAGCHEGYVTDLARTWLDALTPSQRDEVQIFTCGPTVMLEAVARLSAGYDIPCQVSLEEFMACGVGGCAGCAVEVQTPTGTAMKRVCVDGPVFAGNEVFFLSGSDPL